MEQGAETQLPEGATEHTFVVYDEGSGEINHGHTVLNLPDADAPSAEDMQHQALELASEVTGQKGLAVLEVDQSEFTPGRQYRVDPETRRLQADEGESAS